MSTVKLQLIKTDSDFLKITSQMISTTSTRYYHNPYWYEEIGEGMYIQRNFEDIPETIQKHYLRDIKS